jgi:hypothetical protein
MKTVTLSLIIFCNIQIYFGQIIECPKDIRELQIIDTIGTKEFESKKGFLPIPVDNYLSIKTALANYPFNCGFPLVDRKYILEIVCNANANACSVSKGKVTAIAQINNNWVVIVRHGDYRSVYNSLDTVYVKKDQIVNEKEKLGKIDTSDNEMTFEFQLWKGTDRIIIKDWFVEPNNIDKK